jgi:hypothetical protein
VPGQPDGCGYRTITINWGILQRIGCHGPTINIEEKYGNGHPGDIRWIFFPDPQLTSHAFGRGTGWPSTDQRLSPAITVDRLDHLIETVKKPGAVLFLKRRRTAGYVSGFTQIGHEFTQGHGLPDVLLGEGSPAGADHPGALLDTPVGQRDVPRNHDVIRNNFPYDPVIRRIETIVDNNQIRYPRVGNPHSGVRDESHSQVEPSGHLADFPLDRAGISVYIDFYQRNHSFHLSAIRPET